MKMMFMLCIVKMKNVISETDMDDMFTLRLNTVQIAKIIWFLIVLIKDSYTWVAVGVHAIFQSLQRTRQTENTREDPFTED